MDWLYIAALSAAVIGYGYYLIVVRQLRMGLPARHGHLFDVGGLAAMVLWGGLFIGGFFIAPWWLPPAVTIITLLIAGVLRPLFGHYLAGGAILFTVASFILAGIALLL